MIGKVLPFAKLTLLAKEDKVVQDEIHIMEQLISENNSDLAWNHARKAGHRIFGLKNERIIVYL